MSSVIVAEPCPSICWTTFTSAPLAIARLAAVWRSWCGCRSGTPIDVGRSAERGPEGADPQRLAVADAGEDQVVRLLTVDVIDEFRGEEARDRHLTPPVGLGRSPDEPLSLDRSHGLDDDGAVAAQVEPGDAQRGHLAEPDTGIREEQHDQPVGLVGARVEVAVLARAARVSGRGREVVHLIVSQMGLLHERVTVSVRPLGWRSWS